MFEEEEGESEGLFFEPKQTMKPAQHTYLVGGRLLACWADSRPVGWLAGGAAAFSQRRRRRLQQRQPRRWLIGLRRYCFFRLFNNKHQLNGGIFSRRRPPLPTYNTQYVSMRKSQIHGPTMSGRRARMLMALALALQVHSRRSFQ